MARFDTPADLPGQAPVNWRHGPAAVPLALLAGVLWPPLVVTLAIWPPQNWMPGREMDWRLMVLLIGLFAVPAGLMAIRRERERRGRPGSRLGVVWRFMLYGGLLAAAGQTLLALAVTIFAWSQSASFGQAIGATETTLLIYGVGGLPIAILVGVSYALWAGLCAAFIAFALAPAAVKDRLGVIGR